MQLNFIGVRKKSTVQIAHLNALKFFLKDINATLKPCCFFFIRYYNLESYEYKKMGFHLLWY